MSPIAKKRIFILGCIEILMFILLRPNDLKSFFLLYMLLCGFFMLVSISNSSHYIPLMKRRNAHLTGDIIERQLEFSTNLDKFLNINPVILAYIVVLIINFILFIIFYIIEKFIWL